MKNKKIIFGLCLFLLCSCGGENVNSTANKDSSNNPLTSEVIPDSSTDIPESTKPEPITDWRADSVSNMEKAIGERLPFAVFTEYYVDESFKDEDGTFIFYIRDPAKCGHAVSYRDVLLENGFEQGSISHDEYDNQITTFEKSKNDESSIRVELANYGNGEVQELRLMAYLIRKATSWPLKAIASVVGYEIAIPSFEANEYYIYPNQEKHEIELCIPQDSNQCVTTYRELLVNEGWNMVDGTDSTPYFASQQNYEIEFQYSGAYFQILIRYNGTNPPLIEGDIVITHQWFRDSGEGYKDTEFSYGGITYTSVKMAKIKFDGEYIVQMKKNESYFQNIVAMTQGIESITIDVVNVKEEPYRGKVTVYAVDANENKTKIEETDGKYNLNGTNYFMIANESSFVFYFRSLSIQLAK